MFDILSLAHLRLTVHTSYEPPTSSQNNLMSYHCSSYFWNVYHCINFVNLSFVMTEDWMKDLKDNRDLRILQTWDVPERYVHHNFVFNFQLLTQHFPGLFTITQIGLPKLKLYTYSLSK